MAALSKGSTESSTPPFTSVIHAKRSFKSRSTPPCRVTAEMAHEPFRWDLAADQRRVANDVVAEARAAAGIGHKQTAQHPDDGRFPRPIRPQEPQDLALTHPDRDVAS